MSGQPLTTPCENHSPQLWPPLPRNHVNYANLGNDPPYLQKHGLYFSQSIVWDKPHPVLSLKDFMGAFKLAF